MRRRALQREVPSEAFDGYLAALVAELGLRAPVEDGVGEVASACMMDASLALSRADGFVAARWMSNVEGQTAIYECFFVRPHGQQARAGLRARWAGERVEELEAPPPELPTFWAKWADPAMDMQGRVPEFLELVAVLCARGATGATTHDLRGQLRGLVEDNDHVVGQLDEVRTELRRAKARLREMQSLVEASADAAPHLESSNVDLTDLADVPTWAADNVDRIVLMPRAINGIRKSAYERPEIICRALMLLAGPYRDVRLGALTMAQFEEVLLPTGLRLAGSVSPSVAGEQGDAYFVRWRGQSRFLGMHLIKGGGREERYCCRIYFFWCDETQRVVVGSGVAHLSNSLS